MLSDAMTLMWRRCNIDMRASSVTHILQSRYISLPMNSRNDVPDIPRICNLPMKHLLHEEHAIKYSWYDNDNYTPFIHVCPYITVTHWGRVTHICVGKQTSIGSDNGLSPGRRQAIIWTNAGILLIGPLGTNFSEISIKIVTFSYTKMCLKVSSANWRPFCLGLNVLTESISVHWMETVNWFNDLLLIKYRCHTNNHLRVGVHVSYSIYTFVNHLNSPIPLTTVRHHVR